MINKKTLSSWLILCAVFFLAFRILPQKGIIPGEPDEFIYSRVSRDLGWGFPPYYLGAPFVVQLPLFPILSAPIIKITGDPLFSVRIVSFVLTLVTSLVIFWYLIDKFRSHYIATLGAAFFLFNPLTVFYSQIGVLDPTLSLFLFIFFIFLERAMRSGRLWLFLLAGLASLASIFTKYTGLYTIPILLLVFFLRSVMLNMQNRENLKRGYLFFDYKSLLAFSIPTVFSLSLLFFVYRHFPLEFNWQVLEVLGLSRATSYNLLLGLNSELIKFMLLSFSPIFLILVIVGSVLSLTNLKAIGPITAMSLVVSLVVFSRLPFYFRYLVILVPFYAILAVIPFVYIRKISLKAKLLILAVIPILYFSLTAKSLVFSYNSTKHDLLEDTVLYVNKLDPKKSAWLLSNYWPNVLSDISGRVSVGWLTLDNHEISIFVPNEKKTGKEIMETKPTYVVIEDYFSKTQIVANGPRFEALQYVVSNYEPIKVISDNNPNFPFTESSNRISIYYLQKQ